MSARNIWIKTAHAYLQNSDFAPQPAYLGKLPDFIFNAMKIERVVLNRPSGSKPEEQSPVEYTVDFDGVLTGQFWTGYIRNLFLSPVHVLPNISDPHLQQSAWPAESPPPPNTNFDLVLAGIMWLAVALLVFLVLLTLLLVIVTIRTRFCWKNVFHRHGVVKKQARPKMSSELQTDPQKLVKYPATQRLAKHVTMQFSLLKKRFEVKTPRSSVQYEEKPKKLQFVGKRSKNTASPRNALTRNQFIRLAVLLILLIVFIVATFITFTSFASMKTVLIKSIVMTPASLKQHASVTISPFGENNPISSTSSPSQLATASAAVAENTSVAPSTEITRDASSVLLPLAQQYQKDFNVITNFIGQLSTRANTTIGVSLDDMEFQVKININKTIKVFFDKLLIGLEVTSFFNSLNKFTMGLDSLINAMRNITSVNRVYLRDMGRLEGQISFFKENIDRSLQKLCEKLESRRGLAEECRQIQSLVRTDLISPVETTKMNFASSNNLLFFLGMFRLNITELAEFNQKGQLSINSQLLTILDQVNSLITLKTTLGPLNDFWASLSNQTNPLAKSLGKTFDTVSVDYIDGFTKIFSALMDFFLFVCFVIWLTSCVLLAEIAYHMFVWANTGRFRPRLSLPKLHLSLHVGGLFTICLLAPIAVGFILIGRVAHSELCALIDSRPAIAYIDRLFSEPLKIEWEQMFGNNKNDKDETANQKPTTTETSNQTVGSQLKLNFHAPNNALTGLIYKCPMTQRFGVLHAIGIREIVNQTQLIYSDQFIKLVDQGESMAKKTIASIDLKILIPAWTRDLLALALNITTIFDKIDYNETITQLSKPVIGVRDYETFQKRLTKFAVDAYEALPIPDKDVTIYTYDVEQLKKIWPNVRRMQRVTDSLKLEFDVLQLERQSSATIKKISSGISSLEKLFDDSVRLNTTVTTVYKESMQDFLPSLDVRMGRALRALEDKLLPCDQLGKSLNQLISVTCGRGELTDKMTAFGMSLTLFIAITHGTLFLGIVVIFVMMKLKSEHNVSKC